MHQRNEYVMRQRILKAARTWDPKFVISLLVSCVVIGVGLAVIFLMDVPTYARDVGIFIEAMAATYVASTMARYRRR